MIYRARVILDQPADDVNTEYIIASRRKRDTLDPLLLRRYLFEEIAPEFAASIAPGDVIVAGKNFGCGSAMEVAVTALLGAGICVVVARSFARTYYRNAVNNGLLPVICDTARIREGDRLRFPCFPCDRPPGLSRRRRRNPRPLVQYKDGVIDETTGERIAAEPLPEVMRRIVEAGGLVAYFRRYGAFPRV